MRLTSESDGRLVVTNFELFLAVLLAGFVAGGIGVWFSSLPLRNALGSDAICALFALAILSGLERSRFVFDPAARQLEWQRVTPFRRSGGVVPLAKITALSLERDFSRTGQRSNAQRLVLHTSDGPIPVTTAFTGIGHAAHDAGNAIQRYLNASDPSREIPFVK